MKPSEKVDEMIRETGDWRGDVLAKLRKLLLDADPEMVEDWKWMGTPTYYRHGLICVMNPHKGKVKITFDKGAHLKDPHELFNAGLEGNQRRAIDFFEGDKVDAPKLKALIKAALAYDAAKARSK